MKNTSIKKLKFALIFSVASIMGIHAGEAINVHCPPSNTIGPIQMPHSLFWEYKGKSIPRGFFFQAHLLQHYSLDHMQPPQAGQVAGINTDLYCEYPILHGGGVAVRITTNDAGAKQCNPDPTNSYFICP